MIKHNSFNLENMARENPHVSTGSAGVQMQNKTLRKRSLKINVYYLLVNAVVVACKPPESAVIDKEEHDGYEH